MNIHAVIQRPPRTPLVDAGGLDHQVNDMTMTASAEMTLGGLQERLREHGQWLPIDGDPGKTLGELVETNSTGPLRLGYGAWRDLLLGAQFHTYSGRLITAGGRTMKNVAGYDLTKFMVGQFGIFGKLLTITTRTYKRLTGALIAEMPYSIEGVNGLLTTAQRPQWAMGSNGKMYCGYLGDERAIAFYESSLPDRKATNIRRQSLENDMAFRSTNWQSGSGAIPFRASVPPARVLDFVSRAEGVTAFDPIFGIAIGSTGQDSEATLRKAADAVGGTVRMLTPTHIQNYFNASPEERALLERIKLAFDQ